MSLKKFILPLMIASGMCACEVKKPKNPLQAILAVRSRMGDDVANMVAESAGDGSRVSGRQWPEEGQYEVQDSCHVTVLEKNKVLNANGFDFQIVTYDVCQCKAGITKVQRSYPTDILHEKPELKEVELDQHLSAGLYKSDGLVKAKYGL